MLSFQQFSAFVSELCRLQVETEPHCEFDMEWMGGQFRILEACGAQLYVPELTPDAVAGAELVAEPQFMHLLIDFEEAGRQPSPLVQSKRNDANAVLELLSPDLKIGKPLLETAALVKLATPLVHEASDDMSARIFAGNDGVVCLFRFHKSRLASVLVADMRCLPGFVCTTTEHDWFMKAVNFLWEGPGTTL